jgi:hypothetical protein
MTSSAPRAGNCRTLTHIQGFCHKTGRNRKLGHDNNTQKNAQIIMQKPRSKREPQKRKEQKRNRKGSRK